MHTRSLLGGENLLKEHSAQDVVQLTGWYEQYHAQLQALIQQMKQEKGYALVFDCHSYLSRALKNVPDTGSLRKDFNLGTRDHTSADERLCQRFATILQEGEYTASINTPYKGGFITSSYGNPQDNVHVFQLEIKKSLYMQEGYEEHTHGEFSFKPEEAAAVRTFVGEVYDKVILEAERLLAVGQRSS